MIDDWLLIHEFKEITKPKNCNQKEKNKENFENKLKLLRLKKTSS